jgi:molybdenum-dependent DNA-binding transcriptional regulator ModE
MSEIGLVSGGGDNCPSDDSSGNEYGGITDTTSVGEEIIEIYEGLVAATSHIFERVANAW